MSERPRIALWFRYGPAEHAELFHAMPAVVAELARSAEVHYFGMRTAKPIPATIQKNAVIHRLPFTVNRGSGTDKLLKTVLWLAAIPWMARTCRKLNVRVVYMDETIPLTALLARTFFGRNVALTVADFFVDIYFRHPALRWLGLIVRRIDLASWRRLPLIFTRAVSTREFLASHGIPPDRVHPVYDPCDFEIYRPVSRQLARSRYGFSPQHVVIVHHGILHPNKGNDRIIKALAGSRQRFPYVRYLLVGDGPDMARLKKLTAELEMEDRVRFTGWLPRLEEVNEALNAGDIGLVMRVGQVSDNFHMTGALVHSMACGLPILAARLGGVAEVVKEGEAGLLFDPGNMEEFAEKLDVLVRSAERRRTFGKRALALARDLFDMDKVTEATVAPLLELAGAACQPGHQDSSPTPAAGGR
jgi:glycosyltransferase involved in cell wall biosynthesis